MALDDFDEASVGEFRSRKKRSGGLVTFAVFGAGILLIAALLYFAY